MYGKPPKSSGVAAILDIEGLVRWFLLEGQLDHLMEIGRRLEPEEVTLLRDEVALMSDLELRAWVGWMLQLSPSDAANEIATRLL